LQDRRQIQHLTHRIANKMRQVTRRYEVMHGARKKPALVYIPWTGKSCS
jgi:hypothetical protein